MPGVLINMAEIEPANVAPQYTPMSISIAGPGFIVKVTGSRSVMPIVAFKPGIAPKERPTARPAIIARIA